MDVPLFFYEVYRNLDRLSPGSDKTTLKAIEKADLNRNDEINILDIACGKGSSTILLADYFKNSTVEAFDLFKHYIDELDEKIAENNLSDRVFSYVMDMKDPDFANEEFDLIFCEAAVEIIGFKKGLGEWKRLLKPGGHMIVSDLTWLKNPSAQSRKFWKNTYSEIDFCKNKIEQIEHEGYEFIDSITVSKKEWNEYYMLLEENLNRLKSDNSAESFLKQLKKEIAVFRKNSDDYSYAFYIFRLKDH